MFGISTHTGSSRLLMAASAAIVTAAFVSFAIIPSTQSASAATTVRAAALVEVGEVRTTEKTDRLPAVSEAARICEGQAWGKESADCLVQIARESGAERSIRMIADAQPVHTTPNVF